MRPLDCLSGEVSLYDYINCSLAVLGETSEEPNLPWGSSAVHQTTASQLLINPCEDTCGVPLLSPPSSFSTVAPQKLDFWEDF